MNTNQHIHFYPENLLQTKGRMTRSVNMVLDDVIALFKLLS